LPFFSMDAEQERDRRPNVTLSDRFRASFPDAGRLRTYDDVKTMAGRVLKKESNTETRRVDGTDESFLIKFYERKGLETLRSLCRPSRAHREYRNLSYIRSLDVPAVPPAGVGARYVMPGWPTASFLITAYRSDGRSLRDLLRTIESQGATERLNMGHVRDIVRALGRQYRVLHKHRFFLLATSTRDILCRPDETGGMVRPEFIDVPNSKPLSVSLAAKWGQARDLARLFKGLLRHVDERDMEEFLDSYRPDPLGDGMYPLRKRVDLSLKHQANETPISGLVHRFKKDVKQLFS